VGEGSARWRDKPSGQKSWPWAARRGLKGHPTAKPTAMLADALLDLSNRGDFVIDPFLGSGSTLIAADKIGHVSRGVDLDSLYVEVIMRQYAAATGNPAVLIETGEAFDALAREGQGRQRRSRAGFQTRPRHYEALETTAPSTRASACTAAVSGSNPLSSTSPK
jgi:hypothetical protein